MISPTDVRKQAERWWSSGEFLKSELLGHEFFPRDVRFGKILARHLQDDFLRVSQDLLTLKNGQSMGYQLELIPTTTRNFGTQYLPHRIWLESKSDFLKCIGKARAFDDFEKDVSLLREKLPALSDWVLANPLKIEKYHSSWDGLIKVCLYFVNNPQPGLYIRELPIEVHTKFIEKHKGILALLLDDLLPSSAIDQRYSGISKSKFEQRFGLRYDEGQVRIRMLDSSLALLTGVEDMALPPSQMNRMLIPCQTVFIVENLMPFLTFPKVEQAIVVFGKGFAVGALQNIFWLADKNIYYWGDLDAQGFEILDQLRSYFNKVKSILMDRKTLETHNEFIVPGTKTKAQKLSRLTQLEWALYQDFCECSQRLEQERIEQKVLIEQLENRGFKT